MQTVTLAIEGMTCGGCVKNVTRVLSELDGVEKVEVSLEQAKVVVTFDETKTNKETLKETVEDAGYDVAN